MFTAYLVFLCIFLALGFIGYCYLSISGRRETLEEMRQEGQDEEHGFTVKMLMKKMEVFF